MAYSLTTATNLIGKARTKDFQCNHVVNEVLTGNRYGRLAKDYLNYGREIADPQAGAVVVDVNGKHVGIFISSTEFIHSSSSQMKVVRVPAWKVRYVFPDGHQYRIE
jgi:hypothetical protein